MDWVHWEADFVGIEESEFLLGGVWINSCSPTDMENFSPVEMTGRMTGKESDSEE